MANIHRKLFVRGLTGTSADQFVTHTTRSGKTITASRPLFDDNLAYTETQDMQQAALRDAATYANFACTQPAYLHRAQAGGTTAYTLAAADWFGPPRVLEINVDGWTGQIGQTIRVKARDNVMVASVEVVLRDGAGKVLEMGEAVPSAAGSAWWEYTTQTPVAMTPFPSVEAIARDLPGNRDSFIIS